MTDAPKGKSTLVVVLAVVGAALAVVLVIVGILAALGVAGFRNYLSRAKGAEGKSEAYRLGRGIARCAETGGGTTASGAVLPPGAPPVPASLSDVSARKYLSSPADWSHATYACAGFSMGMPQYFQYEWQVTGPGSGKAVARADLDGDGKVDREYTSVVTCEESICSAAMPPER
ncbi:MAG: hypothetical protein IT377_19095 [Polyangiaceae bacterium]|nr:hypothetical protein [Polyangiaceae bacterium]